MTRDEALRRADILAQVVRLTINAFDGAWDPDDLQAALDRYLDARRAPQPEEEPGAVQAAIERGEVMRVDRAAATRDLDAVRAAALEEAANLMERMVVGGRAWTQEQADAAKVLFDAAAAIRSLAEAKRGSAK